VQHGSRGAFDETERGRGMKSPPRLAVWATLCGTVVLTGWGAAGLAGFGSRGIENTGAPIKDSPATSVTAEHIDEPKATALVEGSVSVLVEDIVSVPHIGSGSAALPDARPAPPPAATPMQLASLSTPDPVQNAAKPAVSSFEALDACL